MQNASKTNQIYKKGRVNEYKKEQNQTKRYRKKYRQLAQYNNTINYEATSYRRKKYELDSDLKNTERYYTLSRHMRGAILFMKLAIP